MGLWGKHDPGNPACDIGAALRLAKRWNIKFVPGVTYGSVRAVDWEHRWMDRPDLCMAICDLVIDIADKSMVGEVYLMPDWKTVFWPNGKAEDDALAESSEGVQYRETTVGRKRPIKPKPQRGGA